MRLLKAGEYMVSQAAAVDGGRYGVRAGFLAACGGVAVKVRGGLFMGAGCGFAVGGFFMQGWRENGSVFFSLHRNGDGCNWWGRIFGQ